jgi:hypothetical protein
VAQADQSSRRRVASHTAGRSCLVADEEQVAEHLDRVALLAFAEQRRDRHAEVLAEQVEQRRFDRGHGVDRRAQVEGLQAAAAASRSANVCCTAAAALLRADRLADDESRASSSVWRIFSPPGTSPTPVRPALSVRISRLR